MTRFPSYMLPAISPNIAPYMMSSGSILGIRESRHVKGEHVLEAGELIPMARPMTADIEAFRRQENPDYQAVRAFTYKVMQTLKQACEIF